MQAWSLFGSSERILRAPHVMTTRLFSNVYSSTELQVMWLFGYGQTSTALLQETHYGARWLSVRREEVCGGTGYSPSEAQITAWTESVLLPSRPPQPPLLLRYALYALWSDTITTSSELMVKPPAECKGGLWRSQSLHWPSEFCPSSRILNK
jgi:hypothetical protein